MILKSFLKSKWAMALILLGFVLILWREIHPNTPEHQIQRTLLKAAKAFQAESIRQCEPFISFSYEDEYGQDKRLLLANAGSFFEQVEGLEVRILHTQITLSEETSFATSEVYFELSGTLEGTRFQGLLSSEEEPDIAIIDWHRTSGKWQIGSMRLLREQD
ncbi:MAG TPA: hypothetical protein PKH07_03650 [bacterium]|nr:hypothetical protein [bacterium]